MSQIPLNAAASNGDNNRQVTASLPPEVVQCLENARFVRALVHLLSLIKTRTIHLLPTYPLRKEAVPA